MSHKKYTLYMTLKGGSTYKREGVCEEQCNDIIYKFKKSSSRWFSRGWYEGINDNQHFLIPWTSVLYVEIIPE